MENKKQLVTYVDKETYDKVREFAYKQDRTKSKAIEIIIKEYFKLKESSLDHK